MRHVFWQGDLRLLLDNGRDENGYSQNRFAKPLAFDCFSRILVQPVEETLCVVVVEPPERLNARVVAAYSVCLDNCLAAIGVAGGGVVFGAPLRAFFLSDAGVGFPQTGRLVIRGMPITQALSKRTFSLLELAIEDGK